MVVFEKAALLGQNGLITASETVVPEKNDTKVHVAGCLLYDSHRSPHVFIKEGTFPREVSTGLHEAGHALSNSLSFLGEDVARDEKSQRLTPSRFLSTSVELTDEEVLLLREQYLHPNEILPSDDPRQELVKSLIVSIIEGISNRFHDVTVGRIHVVSQTRIGELSANEEKKRVVKNDKRTRNAEVGAMLIEAIGMMIWENTVKKYHLASDSDAGYTLALSSSPAHDRAIQIVKFAFDHDLALPSFRDLQRRAE